MKYTLTQLAAKQAWSLNHIGYVTNNLEEANEAWLASGAEQVIKPSTDPVQRVNCSLLNFAGTPIELVAPANTVEDSPLQSRIKSGGGLDHICYNICSFKQLDSIEGRRMMRQISNIEYATIFDRYIQFYIMRTGLIVEFMADQPY